MKIEVFSDGSATVPSKPGGWAWVMVVDGSKHSEGSGYSPNASNNDMELMSSIMGLAAALKHIENLRLLVSASGGEQPQIDRIASQCEVTLCSDSQLVLAWANGSFRFKQLDKMDKYQQLKYLMNKLNAKTRWIRGHSGDTHNERCDQLAKAARKQIQIEVDKPRTIVDTRIGIKRNGVISIWYAGVLKVVDLETNCVENYNRDVHGKRGSALEIREDKSR